MAFTKKPTPNKGHLQYILGFLQTTSNKDPCRDTSVYFCAAARVRFALQAPVRLGEAFSPGHLEKVKPKDPQAHSKWGPGVLFAGTLFAASKDQDPFRGSPRHTNMVSLLLQNGGCYPIVEITLYPLVFLPEVGCEER